MSDTVETPGTWKVADGSHVPFDEAKAAWAIAAYDALVEVAGHYHRFITYKELAELVQNTTGIRSRSQMRNWIGAVLGKVVDRCHQEQLPSLTALCVRQDQTVGEGYRYVLQVAGIEIPDDLDQHAAQARLACYRHFGATIPEGGGVAALPPDVMAARKKARSKIEAPVALCAQCFVQLPSSGACDDH